MRDYIISCCSTADLTEEHFKARDISYICFHFELNGKEYADDLGKSIPFDQFYAAMAAGADTKTSQVNAEEFEEYFEPFLKAGKDILHITLSSGISGVINSAMIAKENLEERYPDRKILIVDSLGASSGYGLLMDKLADLRDEEGRALRHVNRAERVDGRGAHGGFSRRPRRARRRASRPAPSPCARARAAARFRQGARRSFPPWRHGRSRGSF